MPGKAWTDKETGSLIRQIVVGSKLLPDIEIQGRSEPSINGKRQELRKEGRLGTAAPLRQIKHWNIQEIKKLTDITKRFGFGAKRIAKKQLLPGRNQDSIGQMMRRLNLGQPAIKKRVREAKKLSRKQADALNKFLLGAGRKKSTAEISAKFRVPEDVVRERRRKLGVSLSWHEARSATDKYKTKLAKV